MSSKGYTLFSLRKRILVLIVLIFFVFIALFVRLFIVQVIQSESLQHKAEDQWTRSLPIVAERGEICDTNGNALAVSFTSYNVYTRAKEIKDPVQTANIIAEILGKKFSSLYEKVCDRSASEILITTKIDSETAIKLYKKQLNGVYITENCSRYYPNGDLLTQVLGFTTTDNQGQAGIEAYYNQILKGENGFLVVQSDLTGVSIENSLNTYIPATAGSDIMLTIDVNLQKIVENVAETIMTEQKAKGVNCILMHAKTGEILAMTSKPSFDLNNIPRDDVNLLMQNVKNKSVVDVYEPGSTFKIITMAIALETGVANLNDTFYCPGYCIVNGEKIKCWKSIGHGHQTLSQGLANSCNCVFTSLAQRIGLTTFYDYLHKFGYGNLTGIEIGGESGGILMDINGVKVVDLARMGFGQAVAVSALQQIVGVATVTNGGKLVQPYIVKKIIEPNGQTEEFSAKTKRQVVSNQTSATLNDMLNLTMSQFTGEYSFVNGYAIGGKTGTTQKYVDGKIKDSYISSFVGTYPVNNPEYVLLIAVDEPGSGAYFGSVVASPYAKIIFQKMFEYYNIPPDDPALAKTEATTLEMPNLINLTLTDAIKTLQNLKIPYEISGEGSRVVSQYPYPTIQIFETDTIQFELG